MSSIPQFYSNITKFPSHHEFYRFTANPEVVDEDSYAIWNDEDLLNPLYYGNGTTVLDQHALHSSPESDTKSSIMAAEQLVGISNNKSIICSAFSNDQLNMGYLHGVAGINHHNIINNNNYIISEGYQLPQNYVSEFGEECCGVFMPDIKPIGSVLPTQNMMGMQNINQMHRIEEPNTKVLRYSEEERKERILKYLKKRNQRNFKKTIKYACRKNLADRRVRVRGRFAKNNQVYDHAQDMRDEKINSDSTCNNILDQTNLCCETETHVIQMKYNDEDWLQEAMASLVCTPNYVAAG